MKDRDEVPVTVVVWRGITIHVRYQARCHGFRDLHHLDIESVEPARARLPITSTGYKSHFYYGEEVENVSDAVLGWLEMEAGGAEWAEHQASTRQLTLF
jgi:hypothetical protein